MSSEEQPSGRFIQVFNTDALRRLEQRKKGILDLPTVPGQSQYVPCSADGKPITRGQPVLCTGCSVILCPDDFNACSKDCDQKQFVRLASNQFSYRGQIGDGLSFAFKPTKIDMNQIIPAVEGQYSVSGLDGTKKVHFHKNLTFTKIAEPKVILGGKIWQMKPLKLELRWRFYRTFAHQVGVSVNPVGELKRRVKETNETETMSIAFHPHVNRGGGTVCLGAGETVMRKNYQPNELAFPQDFLELLNFNHQVLLGVLHDTSEKGFNSVDSIKNYAVQLGKPEGRIERQVERLVLSSMPLSDSLAVHVDQYITFRNLGLQNWNFALSFNPKGANTVLLCFGAPPKAADISVPVVIVSRAPVDFTAIETVKLKVDGKEYFLRDEQCQGSSEVYFSRYRNFVPVQDDNGQTIAWVHRTDKQMIIRYNFFGKGSPLKELFPLFLKLLNLAGVYWTRGNSEI